MFRNDHRPVLRGPGEVPGSLQEMVDKRKYLRDVPKDPFTRSNDTWVIVAPRQPGEAQEVKGSGCTTCTAVPPWSAPTA